MRWRRPRTARRARRAADAVRRPAAGHRAADRRRRRRRWARSRWSRPSQDGDDATLIFAGGWWTLAAVLGLVLGSSPRAGEAMARALASARTATSLPTESPGRIAFLRLWPIGAFALVVGGLGVAVSPGRRGRRRLRDPERARLAKPRAGRDRDRGARRGALLRRADLGPGADQAGPDTRAGARSHARRPSSAAAAGRRRGLAERDRPRGAAAGGARRRAPQRAKAARAPIAATSPGGAGEHQGRPRVDRLG